MRAELLLPGTPIALPFRRRVAGTPRPLHRVPSERVGRRTYRVCVTLQMPDGSVVAGFPLGPERQTRLQARKLLKRIRAAIPEAGILRGQEVL